MKVTNFEQSFFLTHHSIHSATAHIIVIYSIKEVKDAADGFFIMKILFYNFFILYLHSQNICRTHSSVG